MNQDPDDQPSDPFAIPKVGKGWRAAARNYWDPQSGVTGSNHPYASFPGNALKWDSYVFDDGTTCVPRLKDCGNLECCLLAMMRWLGSDPGRGEGGSE